jgi:hypothetical protein
MMESQDSLKKIPREFFQDAEKKLFTTCSFCEVNLGETTPYMIEKAFKVHPESGARLTLYEYAICHSCSVKKMEAMSKDSVQNIQRYMQENVYSNWDDVRQGEGGHLDFCMATGSKISDLSEYSYVGQFIGKKMVVGLFPMAFDASLGEVMQDLLSESTKKEFDDFMDTITSIPPELKELFKEKRPVMV